MFKSTDNGRCDGCVEGGEEGRTGGREGEVD